MIRTSANKANRNGKDIRSDTGSVGRSRYPGRGGRISFAGIAGQERLVFSTLKKYRLRLKNDSLRLSVSERSVSQASRMRLSKPLFRRKSALNRLRPWLKSFGR